MDVELYRSLFVHREDVFAQQHADGSYTPVKKPLSDINLAFHLKGDESYGVYVIEPDDNSVSYLVFDLDTYEEEAVAWLVYCLNDLVEGANYAAGPDNKRCLLMENSGGKGFHAWLFLSEPLPAAVVRAWVGLSFMPLWSQQAEFFDGTPLEVFPKQDALAYGGYGNLVKLPFGVHAKSGRRSEIVPCQGWANAVDSVQRLDSSLIPVVAAPQTAAKANAAQGAVTAPFPCVQRIIEEGAPQGCRDKAMYHFARFARTQGLPEDLVLDWCERVNDEFSPPLTDTEVQTKVRSACGAASEKHSCNADWLKDFCPGGEQCKAPWNEMKPGKVNVAAATSYLEMSPEQRREARGNK